MSAGEGERLVAIVAEFKMMRAAATREAAKCHLTRITA